MSNLLQKASIITTSTAYNTGKILSVKPVQTYGPELVTNGDFATDSGWTKGSNWTISGGKANSNGSGLIYQTSVSYVDGKTYKVTFDANITSGAGTVRLGNTSTSTSFANGANEFYLQTNTNNTTRYIFFQGISLNGSIDNVSVKEALNADFDFTRNSSATRVGSNGLIQDVASNIPRIDYTGGVGSWKFEPQRTNSITYSEDFSQSYWTKSGSSTVSNNAISPDGTLNASKLIENSSNSAHQIFRNTVTASGNFCNTIFVKAAERSKIRVNYGNSNHEIKFDLSNGTIISQVNATGNIVSMLNGWFKCTMSWTSASVSAQYLLLGILDDNGNVSYTGDGSSGVYIFGAQFESGSYPTSYIRSNSGSATTRLADVANNAGSSNLINSTEGVLYAEFSTISSDAVNSRYIGISNGSADNRIAIRQPSGVDNQVSFFAVVGGSVQVNLTHTLNILNFNKIAIKYKVNDFALWVNGIELATDTSGTVPSEGTFNKLDFANFNGSSLPFEGNTKSVAVFKEALTDLELECLVSWMSFSDLGINFGYTVE